MSEPKQVLTLVFLFWCVTKSLAVCFLNITSVECQSSKAYCDNPLCNFTLHDQFSVAVNSIGCALRQDVSCPKLRIRHEVKIGANKYGPGMFDHQFDICEMVNGISVPVLYWFVPKKVIDVILHPCPYKQKEEVFIQDFLFNSRNIPVVFQTGEYRMSFAIRKGRYVETFSVKVYGHRCVSLP